MSASSQAPALEACTIDLTPEEHATGRLSDASRAKGVQAMHRLGFLQINNVLTRERGHALHRAYEERYAPGTDSSPRTVCYTVGHKRDIVAVDLAGPFNDPGVYANPFVFPIVDDVLGGTAELNSFGVVCALPGAQAQRVHVEHPPLFAETNLEPLLPCHAVTVMLPLIDLDAVSGSTAVWLGSHRDLAPVPLAERQIDAAFVPAPKLGAVYMMDYRLVHCGTANRSTRSRPILYAVYARPWFSDLNNIKTPLGLRISAEDLALVPRELRRLFLHRSA
jgi:hypothetical protein